MRREGRRESTRVQPAKLKAYPTRAEVQAAVAAMQTLAVQIAQHETALAEAARAVRELRERLVALRAAKRDAERLARR